MRRGPALWAMVVVLLAALVLRAAAFGRHPPGLYRDEAIHGLDALDVLEGRLELYFQANNGREPLYIYLVALSVSVFGRSPFAVRLPSLFAGLLTVAATAMMGRALFSRHVGLLAAAVLAVTLWHVHLSRTGYRAVLMPLVTALGIAYAATAVRSGRRGHWAAAGGFVGLSAYTYTAARVEPVALGATALASYLAWRPARFPRSVCVQRLWAGVGVATLTAVLVAGPFLVYAIVKPAVVLGRPGQVSVFSSAVNGGAPWATLGRHVLRSMGMFFVRGDRIWRHNVPWRPVYEPLLGMAFLVGVAIACRRSRRDVASAFVLTWTAVMLLPTILAEDAPHFLRAVGVLPVVSIFPALALDWAAKGLRHALIGRDRSPSRVCPGSTYDWTAVLVALPLAIGLVSTAHAYFGAYAHDSTTAYWFEQGAVALAGSINSFLGEGWDGEKQLHASLPDREASVQPKLWDDWPQVRFLVSRPEQVTLGAGDEPVGSSVATYAWPYGDWAWMWSALPQPPREVRAELGPLSQGDRDPAPYRTYLALFALPLEDAMPVSASFAGGVDYLGSEVRTTDEGVVVRLRWGSNAPLETDYTIFVHYLRDGTRIGQRDAGAASGLFPTSQWKPGDRVIDDHLIQSVNEVIPGRDVLRFGFWQPESGDLLYVVDEAGNPVADWLDVPVTG